MADYASSRASLISRSSTFLNRPNQAPLGPRTRNRSSHTPQVDRSTSPPGSFHARGRPASTTPTSPPYLPEFGPPPAEEPDIPSLTTINEGADAGSESPKVEASQPPPTPPSPFLANGPKGNDIESSDSHESEPLEPPPTQPPVEQAESTEEPKEEIVAEGRSVLEDSSNNQVPQFNEESESKVDDNNEEPEPKDDANGTPSSIPMSLPSSLTSPVSSTFTKSQKATPTVPKLTPPPAIKFESTPVQWKGLPLEAAVWTFDSKELQTIVSRAIRSSASESYIRLLAIDILDDVLPSELERLEAQKTMTQAKHRFLVHRRTMLLQALLSSSLSQPSGKEAEDGILTATKLIVQLSETTAECDHLMEDLLKTTDQISQIKRLLDRHWASALAIALRKLNGSYGRRTSELAVARERIIQLQAELDDAWTEAEKLAREMDDLDVALSDEDEAIIETAERVVVTPGPDSRPMSPTILTLPASTTETSDDISISIPPTNKLNLDIAQLPPFSPISPLVIKSGVPKRQSKGIETPVDVPDSVSIKSSRSTKSARSYRSTGRDTTTRVSVVSAAKKRSLRASQGSLRLPPLFGNGHKRSGSRPKTPYDTEDHPPVPDLPVQFTSSGLSSHSPHPSSTLLHFDSATSDTGMYPPTPYRHSRRTSLDSAHVTSGHRSPHPWNGVAMDDMYVTSPRNQTAVYSTGSGYSQDDQIEVVPRTPPPVPPKIISMEEYSSRPRTQPRMRSELETAPGKGIPSIWMNVDTPKTPAERVDSLMRGSSKGKTYQRLRGLTKRYSLPFPIFSSKANNGQQSLPDRASSQRSGSTGTGPSL